MNASGRERWVIALFVALGVVATACGSSSSDETAAEDQVPTSTESESDDSEPTTTTAAPESSALESSEEQASEEAALADEADAASTIPVSDDPCATPAAHAVGPDAASYELAVTGEPRRVDIRVGADALAGDPTVFVLLHGASMVGDDLWWMVDNWLGQFTPPPESQVVVSAWAEASGPGFWNQSETFNTDYLEALFEQLQSSVCLERATVVLTGLGQGNVAVAQAICGAELPVDLAVMMLGLVKMADCAPPNPIPIISVDDYEFEPITGFHWDGFWSGGSPLETELTGGIEATPDDLEFWADLYNCTDTPTEHVLPDESDKLERDSIALTHESCDAPLVAIGMEDAVSPDPKYTESVDAFMAPYVEAALAR